MLKNTDWERQNKTLDELWQTNGLFGPAGAIIWFPDNSYVGPLAPTAEDPAIYIEGATTGDRLIQNSPIASAEAIDAALGDDSTRANLFYRLVQKSGSWYNLTQPPETWYYAIQQDVKTISVPVYPHFQLKLPPASYDPLGHWTQNPILREAILINLLQCSGKPMFKKVPKNEHSVAWKPLWKDLPTYPAFEPGPLPPNPLLITLPVQPPAVTLPIPQFNTPIRNANGSYGQIMQRSSTSSDWTTVEQVYVTTNNSSIGGDDWAKTAFSNPIAVTNIPIDSAVFYRANVHVLPDNGNEEEYDDMDDEDNAIYTVALPANKKTFVGIQVSSGYRKLEDAMPPSTLPVGLVVNDWNGTSWNAWTNTGAVWAGLTTNTPVITRTKAFLVYNPTSTNFHFMMHGAVVEDRDTFQVPGGYSAWAWSRPEVISLDKIGYNWQDGDQFHRFDSNTGQFVGYFFDFGLWWDSTFTECEPPVLGIGEGFLIYATAATTWTHSHHVTRLSRVLYDLTATGQSLKSGSSLSLSVDCAKGFSHSSQDTTNLMCIADSLTFELTSARSTNVNVATIHRYTIPYVAPVSASLVIPAGATRVTWSFNPATLALQGKPYYPGEGLQGETLESQSMFAAPAAVGYYSTHPFPPPPPLP